MVVDVNGTVGGYDDYYP